MCLSYWTSPLAAPNTYHISARNDTSSQSSVLVNSSARVHGVKHSVVPSSWPPAHCPPCPLSLHHLVKSTVDTGDCVSHHCPLLLSPATPGGQASLCLVQAHCSPWCCQHHLSHTSLGSRGSHTFVAPSEISSSAHLSTATPPPATSNPWLPRARHFPVRLPG